MQIVLSHSQPDYAYNEVSKAMSLQKYEEFLLYGVTGSGKT